MQKKKQKYRLFYSFLTLLLILFSLFSLTFHVEASNEYQLGSEQELFHFIYTKNNVYSVSDPTEQSILAFHPLMENDVTLRNPIPVPVSYLLNVDELYSPGEFFTVYSDVPVIQKNIFNETDQDVIDVTRIQLENAVGDPVDTIRQGRPYKGSLDLVIHTEKLSGSLHSIFYKLPGQLDSIGTDPVLLKSGNDILGKIYQSKSGDRYFQIDFDETKLDGLGDLQVTLPIQVRARPEIKAGNHSIAFARNQAQKINIEPYDPGIFSWVDVSQYADQPMNQARAQRAVKWESDNSFTNYVIADLYPDAIRRDHPKFQGYDKMAFPTFFYGVDSSGTTYYPDEVGLCIDPFHTITQSQAPLFKAQIEDFIMDEGARKLNLSLHMAAWRAQTAHDDPMQVLMSKDPIKGVQPLKYDVTNYTQQYIRDRKDTGRRWMGGGQMSSWLFSMKYNRDNNNRIDNIVDDRGINYNTNYFWPNAWKQEVDYKPDLTILADMRDLYEDTSYISGEHLLSKKNSKVIMEVPNSNKTSGFRGFENITYTQRDFDHYIDIEASKAASKRKDKDVIEKCLDIKQEYQDIYEKKIKTPYVYYNRSNNVPVKQTKVGEPFTKLEVTAKCDLNPGDVKLVIRKNTRDFWNDSIGYTASVANGRQFVGMFAIPPSYRPEGEIDFYTGNGSVNLVKYDEENPPSNTNEGTRLNGAEFELYDASQTPPKKIGTYTTEDYSSVGQNGVIIVKDLPPGEYYFIETKPPKGYQSNSEGKYPFTIKEETFETVASTQDQVNGEVFIINGNIPVLGVPNKKIPDKEGEVEIEKISSEDGQYLSGAVFMLYEEDARKGTEVINAWNQSMRFTPVENKSTNTNGMITFDHLVYGQHYMIKEVEAPDGYQLNKDNVCAFKLTDQGIDYGTNNHCFDGSLIWQVENDPTDEEVPDEPEGEIKFQKKGREFGAGKPDIIEPLSNVTFGIYKQENDEFVKSVYSNQRGEVNSGKLPPGRYYFKEIATISGYELSDTEIPFTIDDQGDAYFEDNVLTDDNIFYNDKLRPDKGDLVITKYDADGLGKTLEGAEFKLCPNSPTSPQCKQIGTTNASGELPVKDLDIGTYYLIETKAPEGYDLDDTPIKVEITADGLAQGVIHKHVTNQKTPIRHFEFQKIDKKGNGLPGAEFTLQKETQPGVWTDTGDTYTTDSYGFIIFEEDDIAQLGEGNYRLKETKAPDGYQLPKGDNIYSNHFYITKDNVIPRSVTMENKRLDHELTLQKKVENDWASPANVIFVVQARKDSDQWERFGSDSFMTNASGQIKVNNDTAPGLIDDMLSNYESNEPGTYNEFRFREAIVPPASKLEDPQYLGTSEPPGDPGDRFSVLIPIEEVKQANDRGENYKTSSQNLIILTDKIIRYRLSFTKKDSVSEKLINGAEFTLEEYAPGIDPLENKTPPTQSWVLTPNSKGEYHQDGLLIDRTYILKETKAPENYGARSDFYLFKLNYEYVLFPGYEGIGEMQETMFVSVVHEDGSSEVLTDAKDYLWDSNVNDKHLTFIDKNGDFKNTALPKIPVTGGTGFTIFSIIGLIFSGFGYLLYLYIEKKLKRSE